MALIFNTNQFLLPFNMQPESYAEMFRQSYPDRLTVVPGMLYDPVADPSAVTAQLDRIKEAMGVVSRVLIPDDLAIMEVEWDEVAAYVRPPWFQPIGFGPQQGFRFDQGVFYLQIGFMNADLPRTATAREGLMHAMTLFDVYVMNHQSVEPAIVRPLRANQHDTLQFSQLVSDLFTSGLGVWSKFLIEQRNMIHVMCQALLANRNPFTEWEDFEDWNGRYFLQYPDIVARKGDSE